MAHIGTYDARKTTVLVNKKIITGLAEGSFVKASKDNDGFETSVGAQGDVCVTVNGDNLATIEVTVQQTSPAVKMLDKLANDKKKIPIWVKSDNEVKETVGGSQAMITKPADKEFGNSAGNYVYVFKVFDYQIK